MGPLPWKVMGHILKSWDNDPGPTINLKACNSMHLKNMLRTLWPSKKNKDVSGSENLRSGRHTYFFLNYYFFLEKKNNFMHVERHLAFQNA